MSAVRRNGLSVAAAAGLLGLAGCGGSGGGEATGNLTLGLTDGPVENASEVVVEFIGVVLKPKDGAPLDPIPLDCDDDETTEEESCKIDLLTLTGDNRKVVVSEELPAGEYEWLRLIVNAERNVMDSYIVTDEGQMCSLYIPSNRGLQLVSGVIVTANGVSDYTLDFDVRKSITNPPGLANPSTDAEMAAACADNYVLKPAIRLVDSTTVGTIAGTVDEALLDQTDGDGNPVCDFDDALGVWENVAVYAWEDPDGTVEADDLDGSDDPVASATVALNDAGTAYEYEIGFLLAPETYRLALTCTTDEETSEDGVLIDDFDPASQEDQAFGFLAEQRLELAIGARADGSFTTSP